MTEEDRRDDGFLVAYEVGVVFDIDASRRRDPMCRPELRRCTAPQGLRRDANHYLAQVGTVALRLL